MGGKPDQSAQALLAEIAVCEKYAAELAGFATSVRSSGHEEAADRLLRFSRQQRILALELQGRLAAMTTSGAEAP